MSGLDRPSRALDMRTWMEEGVGFEPTRAFALAVFKTAAIDQLGHPSIQIVATA